jgi:hypothetical protein
MSTLLKASIGAVIGVIAHALTGWPLWVCVLLGIAAAFGAWILVFDGDDW